MDPNPNSSSALSTVGGLAVLAVCTAGLLAFVRRARSAERGEGFAPDLVTWGPPEVLAIVGVYFVSQSATAILVTLVARHQIEAHLVVALPGSARSLLDLVERGVLAPPGMNPTVLPFFIQATSALVTLAVTRVVIEGMARASMESLGLRRMPNARELAGLAAVFLLFFLPCRAIMVAWVEVLRQVGYEPRLQDALTLFGEAVRDGDLATVAIVVVGAVLVAPVIEEVVYRGVLHGYLASRFPYPWAAVVSSVIFSLVHVYPAVLLPIFVLGFLLAIIYERRGSLYDAIVFHALFNLVSLLLAALMYRFRPEWVGL